MGHKARVKRIDRHTASTDVIVRQGAETLALIAETQANLVETQTHLVETQTHLVETQAHLVETQTQLVEMQAHFAEQSLESKEMLRDSRQLLKKVTADGERHARAIEDQRVTINQWNLRQEKMMREVIAATQEMIASLRESRREGVEEARAQRAALFAMIDELKGRGGPATA